MNVLGKKSFAMVDYDRCAPVKCNPEKGICLALPACTHKVIKQIDALFNPPVIFQDMCMGCWDCVEACALEAIQIKRVS